MSNLMLISSDNNAWFDHQNKENDYICMAKPQEEMRPQSKSFVNPKQFQGNFIYLTA